MRDLKHVIRGHLPGLLAVLFLVPLLTLVVVAQVQKPREEADTVRLRAEWFLEGRSLRDGTVGSVPRLGAAMQVNAARARRPPGPGWVFIGPQPTNSTQSWHNTSGRVNALAVDPRNSNTVYLGGAAGGVWKTTDGGQNWTPLTDDQASLAIGSIAIDPTNPDKIYVGTGEQNFAVDSYHGAGILRSSDGGSTWQHIPGPFAQMQEARRGTATVGSLAINPARPNVVLAGGYYLGLAQQSHAGIYVSTDGGDTWTSDPVLSGAPAIEILFTPDGSTAYASLGHPSGVDANGIYKSTDDGVTWLPANGSEGQFIPSGAGVGRIELAMDPNNPQTLVAGVGLVPAGGLLGIWKTTDGGDHWNSLPFFGYCGTQCWYDNVIRFHPGDPDGNTLLAGGQQSPGTLFISRNGGTSWMNITSRGGESLHPDLHALAFGSDGKLYMANDGGAWSSNDILDTQVPYVNLNGTLGLTQFYPSPSIHPDNPQIGLGGAQDNGIQKYTGSLLWRWVPPCGDGGFTAINFLNPSIAYSECFNVSVMRSINGGDSFSSFQTGIASERSEFIAPIAMDPSDPGRLYFGTFRIYQLLNGTLPWHAISPDLTGCTACGGLKNMTVAPSDPNTVYVGGTYNLSVTTGRVQVTRNALDPSPTWGLRSTGLPVRAVFAFAVTPDDAATAYVAMGGFSGFDGDTLGHVFKTTDAGGSWTDISGDFPNIPATDIVIDPNDPNTLYVGTDVGVLFTANGGQNWAPLGVGLPNVPVLGLKLHASGVLRAATHGRGMWDFNLNPGGSPPRRRASLQTALSKPGLKIARTGASR